MLAARATACYRHAMTGGHHAADLARRPREVAALDGTLAALAGSAALADVVGHVVAYTKLATSAEALSLLLYDRGTDELVFVATETLEEQTAASHEPPLPRAVAALMTPERLIVPVRDAERVLGAIDLRGRYDGRPLDDADAGRVATVADELAALGDLARVTADPDLLHAAFARIAAAVPSRDATLVVYGADGAETAFRASHALRHGVIDGVRLPVGQGIAGWVARHREAVRLDDASRDPRHAPELARRTGLVPHSMLCVPMVHEGTLHGVIQVINKLDGSGFDEEELALMQTLAEHAARACAAIASA